MHYQKNAESRCIDLEVPEGTLKIQTESPTWLIESLQTDQGLSTFACRPEREHQRLLNLIRQPETSLSLAYTPEGVIVGQVTLARIDSNSWWSGLTNMYEIAIEVSSSWRRRGIAHHLLTHTLEKEGIENLIIVASALSWHWDTEGLGLTPFRYRDILIQLLAHHGFMEYLTTEPNIRMNPFNVLLARIGPHVPLEITLQFYQNLVR